MARGSCHVLKGEQLFNWLRRLFAAVVRKLDKINHAFSVVPYDPNLESYSQAVMRQLLAGSFEVLARSVLVLPSLHHSIITHVSADLTGLAHRLRYAPVGDFG